MNQAGLLSLAPWESHKAGCDKNMDSPPHKKMTISALLEFESLPSI